MVKRKIVLFIILVLNVLSLQCAQSALIKPVVQQQLKDAQHLWQQMKKINLIEHVLDKSCNNDDLSQRIKKDFFTTIASEFKSFFVAKNLGSLGQNIAILGESEVTVVFSDMLDIKNKLDKQQRPVITLQQLNRIKKKHNQSLQTAILGQGPVEVDVIRPWYCMSVDQVNSIAPLGMVGTALLSIAGINCYVDETADFALKNIIKPASLVIGSLFAGNAFCNYIETCQKNSETQQYDQYHL